MENDPKPRKSIHDSDRTMFNVKMFLLIHDLSSGLFWGLCFGEATLQNMMTDLAKAWGHEDDPNVMQVHEERKTPVDPQ
jgi:hypothetical protein